MSESILIKQATLVNEGQQKVVDVLIKNGRFEKIASEITTGADREIDAGGLHLLPGMIDDQVHFREPGLTHKGDIATESRAAVAGGITSYMEMPNVNPATLTHEALEDKYTRASGKSLANFAFYLGASNDNLEQIKSLDPNAACGVKVFMGASTGNMLVDDTQVLEGIFSSSPVLIATHCEDTPMIAENEEKARQQYGEEVPIGMHPDIRSREACYKSSALAVELARKFGTQLHVLHITTAEELDHFTKGDLEGKSITGEACVHHLFFNSDDYEQRGTLIKCNPSVKLASDQQAILQAVNDGRIDIIATDHAPHTWEEKQNTYFKAPAGLPLVQDALLSLLEHYHNETFSLELIVAKTSHNVARRYQVAERGYVREGYWADCVLVDLNAKTLATKERVMSKCGWTPFEGYEFRSTITHTVINGNLMYEKGQIITDIKGQRLGFNRR
ncbi:dihydroorotase [Pleionea sp. CnH1-48]|uniref:dihydroorotase n=1 Tax=Pleionea sp. CnH1-48 TaxID=2954494 RepID=UPI002097B7E3|nr:dihydroorotase [Pleionea sp. CnH1-48]